jgi:hypothetical protein
VAIESTFAELRQQLRALREALEALGMTVDEDRPKQDDVIVAARLSDDLLAARGLLEEAAAAADDACRGASYPFDAERTRRALTACQQQFQRFAHIFAFELAGHARLDDLASVGRERGRGWAEWVGVVSQALEQSGALVEEITNTLFRCWQRLAARIAVASVSIQNTTIGQVSAARLRERAPARREDAS